LQCNIAKGIYYCSRHKRERLKQLKPVLFIRIRMKDRNYKRKLSFNISRRHWYYLNYFTLYWIHKGRKSHQLQIDRIDNSKGYADENVQVVDGLYNKQKGKGKDLWEQYRLNKNPYSLIQRLPLNRPNTKTK